MRGSSSVLHYASFARRSKQHASNTDASVNVIAPHITECDHNWVSRRPVELNPSLPCEATAYGPGLPLCSQASFSILSTTAVLAQQPGQRRRESPGQGRAAARRPRHRQETAPEKPKTKSSTDEEPVITHHRISVDGKELKYTATAGLDADQGCKGRNRGTNLLHRLHPGRACRRRSLARSCSASTAAQARPRSGCTWATLGPRRVTITDEPVIPPPPFRLVDNEATWLDRTDLVFIDPVGTGYSRAAKPELNAKFHALRGDISSVGEFIRMYLTRYDRWASPLYLIGESYGTTRAAGSRRPSRRSRHRFQRPDSRVVCARLSRASFSAKPMTLPFRNYLPSYAASAWYHKKLPADLQAARPAGAPQGGRSSGPTRNIASILARGDRAHWRRT